MIWRGTALVVLLTATTALAADQAVGVKWVTGSFNDVLAQARAQKKVVLLDAWATWCKFCYQMDRDVWAREEVARAVERSAIPYHPEVDIGTGANPELATKYDIAGLPMTLFIDPRDGRVLARLEGYQTAKKVLATLDSVRTEFDKQLASETVASSVERVIADGGRALRAGDLPAARTAAHNAMGTDPDCKHDDADDAALLLADAEERVGQPKQALDALRLVLDICTAASGTRELWSRFVTLSSTVGGPVAESKAILARAQRFPQDPDAQREAAANLLKTGGDLGEAERHATAAQQVAPADPEVWAVVAAVALKRGQIEAAQQAIDHAIQIDPQNPEYRELRLKIVMAARQGASR